MKAWLGVGATVLLAACGGDSATSTPAANGPQGGAAGAGGSAAGTGGSGGQALAGAGGASAAGGGAAGVAGASGGAGVGGSAGAAACDPSVVIAGVGGVGVASGDLAGWSSYAVDGCSLLYVAPPAMGDTHGALRLRDLATAMETEVAPASDSPRRPTLRGSTLAWEATVGTQTQVRVKVADAAPVTLAGAFDHAGEPRAGDAGVAFTAWLSADDLGDTDVMLRDASGTITALGTGPGQQRWADVSSTHVVWSDFSEDPDGTFNDDEHDVCDLVLYDLATKTAEPHPKVGKQGYAMLGSAGHVVYLNWPADHPEPKNVEFHIFTWPHASGGADIDIADVSHPDALYARPSTRDGLVVWVSGGADEQLLFSPLSAIPVPVAVKPGATSLRAPVFVSGAVVTAGFVVGAPSFQLFAAATPSL